MTEAEAREALAQFNLRCAAKIPDDLPAKGKRHLGYIIEEHVQSAQMHLSALYDSGLEAGPEFTALAEHAGHPKYHFWLEGLRRHLQICEESLAERPPA